MKNTNIEANVPNIGLQTFPNVDKNVSNIDDYISNFGSYISNIGQNLMFQYWG